MNITRRVPTTIGLLLLIAIAWEADAEGQEPLRPQAVIDLAFDEDDGDAQDAAGGGEARDAGRLTNGATRVPSPFWNHEIGRAVLVDGPRKQFVEIAHGPDTSRPRAATIAFFFLNLVPPETTEFVGLFAKRSEQSGNSTNYGVNYGMKGDTLQLYVNDGTGYRVARYSIANTLGHRRRVHVAATIEVPPPPRPDAGKPPGDVRMRLFVDGRIVQPAGGGQGVTIDGDDAWATGIDVAKLENNVPLTLGATNSQREFASGLFDEFLLFDRALSPVEVDRLFVEVAGEKGRELADRESKGSTRPAPPTIAGLAPRGAPVGKTTRIVVTGSGLLPDSFISLPDSRAEIEVVEGSTAEKLLLDVTLPNEAPSGFIPLRVQTEAGLSNAVPFAIDSLPARHAADSSREKPSELPGAFTGTFSGAERPRIWFRGQKGDRVAAEVEARRIGAAFDPVLELKTDRDRPLMIAGESIPLRGDARVETNLPADGLYCVELHDLQFRAPANSPFRLLVGDIALIDAFLPNEVAPGETTLRMVGSGFTEKWDIPFKTDPSRAHGEYVRVRLPDEFAPAGPAPAIRITDVVAFVEPTPPRDAPVPVPRPENHAQPLGIHGRIASTGELDYYTLSVAPGEKLMMKLRTLAIDSPLHGHLAIATSVDQKPLGNSEGQPADPEPSVSITVPPGVENLHVAVRDRYGRGELPYRYRLEVTQAERPDFALQVLDPFVSLPYGGNTLVRLEVRRFGYEGAIDLRLAGDPSVTILPPRIPAGKGTETILALIGHSSESKRVAFVRVVGRAVDGGPTIPRAAAIVPGMGSTAVAGFEGVLSVAFAEPTGISLVAAESPAVFAKGKAIEIPLKLERSEAALRETVRLSLVTTESERPVDPRDPKKGHKPRIEALAGRVVPPGETEAVLRVNVPADVEVKEIQWAVRAELVPHAWSDDVRTMTYSNPFSSKIE
ncbi:MAG: hypothetical protein WD066_15840 [Planctomycetaceae bacterium]